MAIIRGTYSNDRLYGTWQQDLLYGHGGNDFLDGSGGADQMYGGEGYDIYIVNSVNDSIFEKASGSLADLVKATVSFRLPDYVEILRLVGDGNLAGKGNDLSNKLFGNSGNNRQARRRGRQRCIAGRQRQ